MAPGRLGLSAYLLFTLEELGASAWRSPHGLVTIFLVEELGIALRRSPHGLKPVAHADTISHRRVGDAPPP